MTATGVRAKICPACRRVAPVDAALCPMCYRRLDDVEPTDLAAPSRRAAWARAGVGAIGRHARLATAVVLVLAGVAFAYTRYFRPVAPLPAASTATTARATADAWPAAHGGAGAERATDATAPLAGTLAWALTLIAPAVTAPVVDAGAIYLGLADQRLVALDLGDGAERWSVPVAGKVDSAPVVVDGTLYLAHRSGRVTAIDAATGSERWAVELGPSVFASPAVADGTVYVASFSTLAGIDAASGEVLWTRSIGAGYIQVAPVTAGDHLLVATNRDVRFFDRRTGVEHYRFGLREAARVGGNAGTAFAFAQTLYVFDPETNAPWWWGLRGAWANLYVLGMAPAVPLPERRWTVALPRGAFAPVLGEDALYTATPAGVVTARDAMTGAERWRRELRALVVPPVLTGGGLLAVEADALVLLDAASGALITRRPLEGVTVSGIAVTGSVIVLQTGAAAEGIAVIE